MTILIILSVLSGLAGLIQLSKATLGVGLICFGCFLGIMARINQASDHRKSDILRITDDE